MMNACNVNEVTIEDLGFAQRTYNCLRRGKIFTLGQIATMTQKDLLKVRNLGMKSVKEIVAKLGEYGLSLREEIDLDAEYEAYCKMEQEGRFDADVEAVCKGLEELCEEYVIPPALNKNVSAAVAEAVVRAARESGVARL